jgi:predicted AAA+ superfamily ATPase
MEFRRRFYELLLKDYLATHRQMAFVSGPRQVGKTTTCRSLADHYLNWDSQEDRELILAGQKALASHLGLDRLRPSPAKSADGAPVLLLDELHKYPRWKLFSKGLFDTLGDGLRVVVTGSSRLDTDRKMGDSLMGRYFLYNLHPFSVAETGSQDLPDPARVIRSPKRPHEPEFAALWRFGGYPQPFLKRDPRFSHRWQGLRQAQLLREDVREQTQIQQIDHLAVLMDLLRSRSGDPLVYSNLAGAVRVSVDTMRRWIDTLAGLHHGFLVRPWYKNVTRSLRKEPKWYLRDWSAVEDARKRAETFVACHLLKAVDGWNDMGLGQFQLGYLRDKEGREVDFVVVRDGAPWFLVEVKHGQSPIGPGLAHYQGQTGAPFAFQVEMETGYVDADCFAKPRGPLAVPARTFLSQLL